MANITIVLISITFVNCLPQVTLTMSFYGIGRPIPPSGALAFDLKALRGW